MYLHLWPASDPPVCISSSSGGPDEGGICTVGVVAVGVAPRVDEPWVGISRAADHRRFGFEVAFGGGSTIVLVNSEEIGEEDGGAYGVVSLGGVGGADGVGTIVGKVAFACGLEGSDLGFRGGVGSMAANGTRGAQGEACEDADDGDDGEKFDEGEGRPASLSLGKPC